MKMAYFDTIAGISGDMTLGAFISAGMPLERLKEELGKLRLGRGVELEASHREESGITAVKLDVVISAKGEHQRHLKQILELISGSDLSARVKETASKIFMEVARAEAKVHNTDVEKIHFHEVGALDSIVDIVGAAVCIDVLGIERVFSSPVKLGSGGFVQTDHGALPIPAPATMEILTGYPVALTRTPFELTTPTGAAIIKVLSSGMLADEAMRVEAVGYGAGTREIPGMPNVLRVMIGELLTEYGEDEVLVVETNIDDMNPEICPFVIEQLLAKGALDATLAPVIMKKGRPGVLISALVSRPRLDAILGVFFSETTTLGVRIQKAERRKLTRSTREVQTSLGRVKAKAVEYNGIEKLVPEHEECRRLARER
jgi:uncharacterized protein (TIGR00299 family) protein